MPQLARTRATASGLVFEDIHHSANSIDGNIGVPPAVLRFYTVRSRIRGRFRPELGASLRCYWLCGALSWRAMDNVLSAIPGTTQTWRAARCAGDSGKKRIELSRGAAPQAMGIAYGAAQVERQSVVSAVGGCRAAIAANQAGRTFAVPNRRIWGFTAAAIVRDGHDTSHPAAQLSAKERTCNERARWAADPEGHDVSAQKTGRASPTVAGRIPVRCMLPTGQTGQTRRERPVRAS